MEIFQRGTKWVWQKKPGVEHVCNTKKEAYEAAGIPMPKEPDWKLHIPEELPLPEVREYDSMEDAIAEED